MNEAIQARVHWTFWLVGAFALLWNVGGSINFIMQMNPDMIANYRPSEQLIIEGRPLWVTVAFGVAVFGGAVGAVLLLLRRRLAFPVFVVAAVAVIPTVTYALGKGIDFTAMEYVVIIAMPLVVAAWFAWYARRADRNGLLRPEI